MRRTATAVALSLVVLGLAFLLVAGHEEWAGPTLVALSAEHGLNEGDLPVLLLAVVLLVLIWRWWRSEST